MEDELIFVDEEGTVSIEQTVKDTLQNGINDAKRELRADNHTTH
jgi:hypothetical protein